MRNKKTIVIFTEEGNVDGAQAIRDYLSEDKNNLPIIIGSDEFKSIAVKILKDRFLNEDGAVLRFFEKTKKKLEARSIDKLPKQDITFKTQNASCRKAYNILIRYNPCLIILDDISVMAEVLAARAKALPDTQVVMPICGYILNKQCVSKHIDKYFVDNMAIKTALVNEGITEENVILTDFPIPKSFDAAMDKESLYAEYKFDSEKPTILLAVPQGGNGGLREVVNALQEYKEKFNIVVDCGKDREILVYARDRGIKAINEGKESGPLYALADITVSRPCPWAIAKSFYKNCLFIALPSKDAAEERTAEFLKDSIIRVTKDAPLSSHLDGYLNGADYAEIRENAKRMAAERPRGVIFKELDILVGMKG